MSKVAVICITNSRLQSERIIDRLNAAGFNYTDISVLMPETDSGHDIGHVKSSKAPEGTATGAATGGLAGGVLGLLAGLGTLAIPGAGPFLAAGPIMAALSGAAIGATTGGVIGGLIGLGIPEFEARVYEEKLLTGNFLISVHTRNSEEVEKATEIFTRGEALHICSTNEAAVPAAPPRIPQAHAPTLTTTVL
jgi:hypothetical protein